MDNTITSRQIFFILILTLTCYTVVHISKDMAEAAVTGAWLTVLATMIVFVLAAACIVYLGNKYRGQMLLDYAPSLISKPGAYALAIFYILYFLFIAVFLVTEFAKLLSTVFFPENSCLVLPAARHAAVTASAAGDALVLPSAGARLLSSSMRSVAYSIMVFEDMAKLFPASPFMSSTPSPAR